jgi:hypothetical protein
MKKLGVAVLFCVLGTLAACGAQETLDNRSGAVGNTQSNSVESRDSDCLVYSRDCSDEDPEDCTYDVCVCKAGLGDCDQDRNNGCEVNTQSDNNHCGGCDIACSEGSSCQDGVCKSTAPCQVECPAGTLCNGTVCQPEIICQPGRADCDGDPANGCEANTDSDADNCGICGNDCYGTSACRSGRCECIKTAAAFMCRSWP